MADMEIGSFTPTQARELWQWYQQSKQLNPQLQQNFPQRRQIDEPSPHRIFVKNESEEEIPAYGCMEVTGVVTEVGRVFLKVAKPTTICGEYIFNSQFKIAAGAYGWGYAFGIVRMLGGTGTYEPCKRYGATVDSWAISQNHGGFLVYGDDGENEGVVIGRIIGDHCKARFITFQYELDGDNSTATPDSYHDGQDPSPCGTPEIEYPLGEPCTDGSLVVAFFDPNTGRYQAIATKNAILGDPVTRDLLITGLTADGCDIGFTKQSAKIITCDADPEAGSISLGSETVTVVSSITDSGSGPIVIEYTDVYVCGFGGVFESEIATTECPVACSGSCTWTFNITSPSAGSWELTTPCAAGCDCGEEPPEPTEHLPYDIEGEPITAAVACAETAAP